MEMQNINAIFRLGKEEYPERKRTTIIISDEGDKVYVGVKAIAHVFKKKDDGNMDVTMEQYGDVIGIDQNAPISSFFNTLKELFDNVPEIVDGNNTGDKA